MNLDERVFCLLNRSNNTTIEAVGLRFMDGADYLVGLYLSWSRLENPTLFLMELLKTFGKVMQTNLDWHKPGGLACKMSIDVPNLCLLEPEVPYYREIKLELLEIRALNPKPFLALHYDRQKELWIGKPFAPLSCVDSNYGFIPN